MKFSAMLLFTALWFTVLYTAMTHAVWSGDGGFFWDMGVLDFAGGTVVHINAGIAGLVAALVLGKRKGYPKTAMPPHNLGYTLIGASMLWVGWFGFNAGSAVSAGGGAGMAMLVTQIATAGAALGSAPSSAGACACSARIAWTMNCVFPSPRAPITARSITAAAPSSGSVSVPSPRSSATGSSANSDSRRGTENSMAP
jgi:hypothetical protein